MQYKRIWAVTAIYWLFAIIPIILSLVYSTYDIPAMGMILLNSIFVAIRHNITILCGLHCKTSLVRTISTLGWLLHNSLLTQLRQPWVSKHSLEVWQSCKICHHQSSKGNIPQIPCCLW